MTARTLIENVGVASIGPVTPALRRSEGDTNVRSFQAVVEGNGAVTATVVVKGSNTGKHFIDCLTFDLTGTDVATEISTVTTPFEWFRADVISVSGVAARVTVIGAV